MASGDSRLLHRRQALMAANSPAAPAVTVVVPDSGKATDVAEPGVVAEAGVTTSEWKLALGYLAQLAATYTAQAVAQSFHYSLSASLASQLGNFEVVAALVVASYVVSRAIRKFGVK